MLVAPDKFKGSLTAVDVARAIRRGITAHAPDAHVTCVPVADGGDGTLDAAVAAGFERVAVTATVPTPELTTEPGALHAAERQLDPVGVDAVDEDHADVEPVGDALGLLGVGGEDVGAQPEDGLRSWRRSSAPTTSSARSRPSLPRSR